MAKNNDIKITSYYPQRIANTVKRGFCLVTIVAMLAGLTGCGNDFIASGNDATSYVAEYGDTSFSSYYSAISDDDLGKLPSTIESLHLDYCNYVSDLSMLPNVCPNLKRITIINCPSIDSIDFLFKFKNLEEITVNDCVFMDRATKADFEGLGIKVNVSESDLDAADEVNRILSGIITDDMTDREKIQAITFYVIDNYKYKITKVMESNEEPLESMLDNKGGVCASYAYMMNVLLRKAGIDSYEIVSEKHAWNLVELNDKYYYLDATNIKQIPIVSKYLVKYADVGLFYMTDPKATSFSVMEDYDDTEKVIIPKSLIEDINAGQSEKNIWEKYGNSVPARVIELALIIAVISGGFKLASTIRDNRRYRRRRR